MQSIYSNSQKISLSRSVSSGKVSNSSWTATQTNHGFSSDELPIPIYHANGLWQKARADAIPTLGSCVIVKIVDADTFEVAESGRFTITGHGLEVDCFQYVSTSTAGTFVIWEPVNGLSNPMVFAEDADTIIIIPYRPAFIVTSSTGELIIADSWIVTQTNHGFTKGELPIPVYYLDDVWVKARADAIETLGSCVVIHILDENTLELAESGRYPVPGHGLEVECFQYVCTSTAGTFVPYEPVNGLSNPMLFIEDENTVIVIPYRPAFIVTTSTGSTQELAYCAVAKNYTAKVTDRIIEVTSTGVVILLPNATLCAKWECYIDNSSIGDITVQPLIGTQTIQKVGFQTIPSNSSMHFYSNGITFRILA